VRVVMCDNDLINSSLLTKLNPELISYLSHRPPCLQGQLVRWLSVVSIFVHVGDIQHNRSLHE
jgi:hypothetical protein